MEVFLTNSVKDFIHQLPEEIGEVLLLRFEGKLSVKEISIEKKRSISKTYAKINTGIFYLQKQFAPKSLEDANKILYPIASAAASAHVPENIQSDF